MLAERRAKWEAFWAPPAASAEATHRRSAELVHRALQAEKSEGQPLSLLDLGCGGGRVVELLGEAGYRVVGLDLSTRALRTARQRLGPGGRLVQGDAVALPFADSAFDAVVSLGYASVGSYPGVQGELARVLRPGGVALVDFRYLGAYHLPFLPWRGQRLLRAWRRGEAVLPLIGLRPASAWLTAGLQLERLWMFSTYPPIEPWLGPDACLAFERRVGQHIAGVLARVALAQFRCFHGAAGG